MAINELRAIDAFAKAVELGSLRQAAIALGISPQAVSQAMAQLEQHLGVRLLHRTTRHIALTAEGQQFLEATRPALASIERAMRRVQVAKDEIAGPLRIVAPKSSFLPVIWPLIDAFCRAHPEVQPDVHLDDRIGNWVRDRTDVGFRVGAPPEEGLIARQLFPLQLIVCAAPAYLAAHGVPTSIDELTMHRCSLYRSTGSGRVLPWFFKVDGEVIGRELSPALSTDDPDLEVQAVLSGHVIGQLSGLSAAAHLRAGRLVPLLVPHVSDHMSVHVYYGNRTAQPTRVRAFIDMAVEQLLGSQAYVLGSKELMAAEAKGRRAARKR